MMVGSARPRIREYLRWAAAVEGANRRRETEDACEGGQGKGLELQKYFV